jgi:hypothetical protein
MVSLLNSSRPTAAQLCEIEYHSAKEHEGAAGNSNAAMPGDRRRDRPVDLRFEVVPQLCQLLPMAVGDDPNLAVQVVELLPRFSVLLQQMADTRLDRDVWEDAAPHRDAKRGPRTDRRSNGNRLIPRSAEDPMNRNRHMLPQNGDGSGGSDACAAGTVSRHRPPLRPQEQQQARELENGTEEMHPRPSLRGGPEDKP